MATTTFGFGRTIKKLLDEGRLNKSAVAAFVEELEAAIMEITLEVDESVGPYPERKRLVEKARSLDRFLDGFSGE